MKKLLLTVIATLTMAAPSLRFKMLNCYRVLNICTLLTQEYKALKATTPKSFRHKELHLLMPILNKFFLPQKKKVSQKSKLTRTKDF